jgi:hypothetical protein
LIPKYKKYDQIVESCAELEKLHSQNQLTEEKVDILKKLYQEKNELQQDLQFYLNDLNKVRDLIFGEAIGSAEVKCKISKLLDRYNKFFKKRRKEYIKKLLIKTSQVKFTLDYPIRVPVIQNINKNGEQQSIIKSVDLKTIKVENDKCFNVEIDGDNVRVIFNTFLGRAYVHNILTLNTDWFEEDYLKLDGYAAAIYRRFFVIRSGNKFDQLPIKDLVGYFGFLKNSHYPAVIETAFENIKNAGLIEDYKVVVNGGKFSKGYIEVVKSSK